MSKIIFKLKIKKHKQRKPYAPAEKIIRSKKEYKRHKNKLIKNTENHE